MRWVFDPISTIWASGALKSGKTLPSKQRPCGDDEDKTTSSEYICLLICRWQCHSVRLPFTNQCMRSWKNPPSPRADVSIFYGTAKKSSKLFIRSHTDHLWPSLIVIFSTHLAFADCHRHLAHFHIDTWFLWFFDMSRVLANREWMNERGRDD